MKPDNTRRRDWGMIVFILPIGIILMLLSGQIAIRIIPFWTVSGGMTSNIDPENPSNQQGEIPPISIDILTPMAWFDTFLTPAPGDDTTIFFPPFVIFDPTNVATTATPMASNTPGPSPTPLVPSATPLGPTSTPRPNTQVPASSTPIPPSNTPIPTNTPVPPSVTPTATSIPATLVGTTVAVPPETEIGAPNGTVGSIPDGYFIVIDLGLNPLVVNGPSDTDADMIYYERPTAGGIDLDSVIISISMDDVIYYVVFNWGDGVPDTNTNIGDQGPESDNHHIDDSELHDDTGVLIDVDNASSAPPIGTYQYIAIQAPISPSGDGNDGADVDSIEVTDVPIPTAGP